MSFHVRSHHDVELGRARLGRFIDKMHDADDLSRARDFRIYRDKGDLVGAVAAGKTLCCKMRRGQIQMGTVVAFLSALANVTDPWNELVNWFQNLMVTSAKYQLVRDATDRLVRPVMLDVRP
ncbi:MAG: hypothetical protein JO273_23120 [Methylobacteriaceae bacterium]|nr:hypothetical protein [Methylobacteriaceae bacterium]